ncbi:pteridine reductase [Isoalcanivorax beigongshangi]|uniref:Pteridine reductase n=1 Tax=Isoalcanivorax beigongshangi TaxID=3238810 RepID=A0ABV4AHB0_9GAMM
MNAVALVTGAARRIGAVIAEHLHQRGLNVLLHCRHSTAEADALAARLNQLRPDSARVLSADLCDPHAVRRLATEALAQWGRLDVLVNNASSFYATPLAAANDEDWDALVHSNLRAPFLLIQALAPALQAQQGAVVNIIDIYAEKPLTGFSLYCAAKAGLAALTKGLARELGPAARINGVAPGPILWPEQADSGDPDAIIASTALQRAGAPDDIAGAVCWLALDAPYVTGQILAVDGGRSQVYHGAF